MRERRPSGGRRRPRGLFHPPERNVLDDALPDAVGNRRLFGIKRSRERWTRQQHAHARHLCALRGASSSDRAILEPGEPLVLASELGLFALCDRLSTRQAEWQRLWTLTSETWEDGDPETEADRIWLDFNNNVWPGVYISEWNASQRKPDDVVGQLLDHHPVTREGMRAKALALVALDRAAAYGDMRNDGCELNMSLICDVAGPDLPQLGEGA
jgi:hypothetical protein